MTDTQLMVLSTAIEELVPDGASVAMHNTKIPINRSFPSLSLLLTPYLLVFPGGFFFLTPIADYIMAGK